MEESNAKAATRWLGAGNLILGIWLIISPAIFSYTTGQAKTNSIVLGIIVAILAIIRLAAPSQSWASWLNGIAGIWLIIAPFILGFAITAAYWNEVIVGILVAIMGFWNSSYSASYRHHHAAS